MTELFIRHATADDWPTIAKMGARTFTDNGADEERVQAELQGWLRHADNPSYKYENSWLGIVDGQIASHVGYIERTLRYGQAELPFGGIVAVMTQPDFRKRGYADQLMRVVIDQIAQRNLPLSLLDGIPRFYDRFGYVTLWAGYSIFFDVNEALKIPPDDSGYRVRPFQPDDVPALLMCYDNAWKSRPWSIKRSVKWLDHRLAQSNTWVVENPNGAVRGYSAGRVPQDRSEVLAVDQAAAAAILRHTGEQLADQPDQTVHWLNVPNTRTAGYVRRLCSVRFRTKVVYRGGWMGQFIHFQNALDALRPEFVARLQVLGVSGADEATFEAVPEGIAGQVGALHFDVPQQPFLQLVFGFLSPDDIDDMLGSTINDTGRDLLKRLFPQVVNGLAGLDWF